MGLDLSGKGVSEKHVLIRGKVVEEGYTPDLPSLTLAEWKPMQKLFLSQ